MFDKKKKGTASSVNLLHPGV